ncbi:uncharacterized protein [Haliotis asinina]|uniref:uncharacterized protein n=1 Tax=Haliotis asinina TaxID=109174 RepID=UPI00353188E0
MSKIRDLDKMMDLRDNLKDHVSDSPATGTDGIQLMGDGSLCGDLAEPHVISHGPWEDMDSDMACSLCSDDSNSSWQDQESMCLFTENAQSDHPHGTYFTSTSKDGDFVIGIGETISRSTEYCIWDFKLEETADRDASVKAASDKSQLRQSRIQAVVIVVAFVLSSIVLLCVFILALV